MSTNLKMNEKHEACKELEGSRLYKIGVCAEPDYCFTHYLESGYKESEEEWLTEIQIPVMRS